MQRIDLEQQLHREQTSTMASSIILNATTMPIKIITSYPMQLRTDIIDKMNTRMLEPEQSNRMEGIQDEEGFIH